MTTGTTMQDEGDKEENISEQQYIKLFSQRIIRERTGNFHSLKKSKDGKSIFPSIDSKTTTNRGNKLLQGAENVTRKRMFNETALNEDTIYYNGSEHKLLHRKRMKFFPPGYNKLLNEEEDDDDEQNDDDEMDLHKLVDVRDILTPIASLSDVINKKSVSRTFQNKIINDLSLKTILMIEKEQSSVNRYSKLLDVFLGDYPKPLYEKTLKLEDYDHNLTLPEEDENDKDENTSTRDSNLKEVITPAQEDPFFSLPRISNKDGLSLLTGDTNNDNNNNSNNSIAVTEQMELTRQMTQIALQRNEEFIRNLLKIRNFLDKSTRIRERVLAWGKESAGVQDEGVTVPNVLRVVKRGLISINANKIVNDENNNNNNDDDVPEDSVVPTTTTNNNNNNNNDTNA